MKDEVIVIGHKNPDTDSVCSAICYANLKNKITADKTFVAKRAGHLNEETHYILDRIGMETPEYIKDVRPQVKDIEIRKTAGVSKNISVRAAWKDMKENNVVTLPITNNNKLKGIVTIGDIARSYFEVYENTILATAKTSISNIVDTLEGEIITGDDSEIFEEGKVVIASATPDMMENYIAKGDLVICGNRYETQLCAIEMEAKCLVVCDGTSIPQTIKKLAASHECIIISTKYDTYTCARLINQSMPISYFMKKRSELITFHSFDFIEDIHDTMAKKRHRDFPIEDESGNYVGMISRRNLLGAGRKEVIMVDHNEKSQAIYGIETANILEIIDHHRLGSIQTVSPVFFRNQPLGCTATIVYQMYLEKGVEVEKNIAFLLCSAIISDTLLFKSPTCTVIDENSCRELAKIAGIESVEEYGRQMLKAGSNLLKKEPKDLFYQDFKQFSVNNINIGVGQVNSMNTDEIEQLKVKLTPIVQDVVKNSGTDMAFLMLTDIMDEASTVICAGKNASNALMNTFGVESDNDTVYLKGVVSRKMQLFPAIMEALQQ